MASVPFELDGKTVFVAGHRGMVGAALVRRLASENVELLTATRRDLIIALAARLGLPAIYSFRFYAASGGLTAHAPAFTWWHPGDSKDSSDYDKWDDESSREGNERASSY